MIEIILIRYDLSSSLSGEDISYSRLIKLDEVTSDGDQVKVMEPVSKMLLKLRKEVMVKIY